MPATLVFQRVRSFFRTFCTQRGLFFWSPVLLASIAFICEGVSLWMFYSTVMHQQEVHLAEEISEQVKLLEAIGRSTNWDVQKTLKQYNEFATIHHRLGIQASLYWQLPTEIIFVFYLRRILSIQKTCQQGRKSHLLSPCGKRWRDTPGLSSEQTIEGMKCLRRMTTSRI